MGISDGFIGNRGATRFYQPDGLGRIGGQMQVGEEDMILTQAFPFHLLRLLDLDDHFRVGKNALGIGGNFGTGGAIRIIIATNPGTGTGLNQHLMAPCGQLLDAVRHQPDTEFPVLDFSWYTYAHDTLPIMVVQVSYSIERILPKTLIPIAAISIIQR